MKVAIQISGPKRTIEHCIPVLLSNLEPNHEYDFFLCIVGEEDPKEQDRIINLFNKVYYTFIPVKDFSYLEKQYNYGRYEPGNVFPQAYSTFVCHQLRKTIEKQEHKKYDVVVRTRTDNTYGAPLPINENAGLLHRPNLIIIPDFGHYSGFNDQIAIGNAYGMDHYCEWYNWLCRLDINRLRHTKYSKIQHPESFWIAPEFLLRQYLDSMQQVVVKKPIQYRILRSKFIGASFSEIPKDNSAWRDNVL